MTHRRLATRPQVPSPDLPLRDRRRHHRWPVEIFGRLVIGGWSRPTRTLDLSLGGALVAAVDGATAGAYGQLELPSIGSIRCRIVATSSLGCHLAFEHENSPPVADKGPSGGTSGRPAVAGSARRDIAAVRARDNGRSGPPGR